MESLNKKDLEKVQGGYSGWEKDGYKSIENPEIGDIYNWLGSGGYPALGPGMSYKYTSEGWMDIDTGKIVYKP